MKKLIISTVAFLGCFLASISLARAQIADRPKVAPEQHQLAMFVGEWSYEGTLKDSVTGPGGHCAGKETVRFTMDGLFLESHGRDTGVYGGKEIIWEGMGLRWYDAAAKQYKSQSFNNDGFVDSGTLTVVGRTWTYKGGSRSIGAKGQQFLNRNTTTFSTDGKATTSKGETSFDNGKTWLVIWEGTGKKTKD